MPVEETFTSWVGNMKPYFKASSEVADLGRTLMLMGSPPVDDESLAAALRTVRDVWDRRHDIRPANVEGKRLFEAVRVVDCAAYQRGETHGSVAMVRMIAGTVANYRKGLIYRYVLLPTFSQSYLNTRRLTVGEAYDDFSDLIEWLPRLERTMGESSSGAEAG